MIRSVIRAGSIVLLGTALPFAAHAADLVDGRHERSVEPVSLEPTGAPLTISGRAAVMDGRTLWFPKGPHMVRLASIDACELPQWSFDPRRHGDSKIASLCRAVLWRRRGSSDQSAMPRSIAASARMRVKAFFLAVAWSMVRTSRWKCCASAGRGPSLQRLPTTQNGRTTPCLPATACGQPTFSTCRNGVQRLSIALYPDILSRISICLPNARARFPRPSRKPEKSPSPSTDRVSKERFRCLCCSGVRICLRGDANAVAAA